jgi:uncharacterized membrane protein
MATIAYQPGTATTTASATTSKPRRRWANVTLWVVQVLTAALYVFGAIPKLTANPQAVEGFNAMHLGTAGMYIVGALEVAGAVGLLIPRLCGLAATAFVALMIGAVIATVLVVPSMVAMPASVLVVVAILAWARRDRTAALVELVRR